MKHRLVPIILLMLLLLPAPWTAQASQICVWSAVDGTTVTKKILEWEKLTGLENRKLTHTLNVNKDELVLSLTSDNEAVDIVVKSAPDCSTTTDIVFVKGQAGWISKQSAERLIESFQLSSSIVESTPAPDVMAANRSGVSTTLKSLLKKRFDISDPFEIAFVVIAALFIMISFCRPYSKRSNRIIDAVFGLALMLLSARAIFGVPFSVDAQILRVAYAAENVFGDWNHPFLSYLLNRPAALLSHNPIVLRIVPFLWVLLEAALFTELARKIAGRAAAALVIVWMAMSIRLTVGMIDLSDWNLAGMFLAGMALWIWKYSDGSLHRWMIQIPSILILGGCFSSYLMIVPAATFTAFVVHERFSKRVSTLNAGLTAAAFIFSAGFAARTFMFGRTFPTPRLDIETIDLIQALVFVEAPLGLAAVMPFLAAGGILSGLAGKSKAFWLFCVTSIVASAGAIVFAWLFSSVNGAYYFGLMKGLVYLAAAVFCAHLATRLVSWTNRLHVSRWSRPWYIPALCGGAVILLTAGINSRPAMSGNDGLEKLSRFIELTGRGKVDMCSNSVNATILMEYQEVLAGRMDMGVIIDQEASTWIRRTLTSVEAATHKASQSCPTTRPSKVLVFWYTQSKQFDQLPDCPAFKDMQCAEILVDVGHAPCADSDRLFCYYECVQKPVTEVTPGSFMIDRVVGRMHVSSTDGHMHASLVPTCSGRDFG